VALGNTPRRETTFAVEANKSYAFGLHFQTPDGLPVDLTGCEVRLIAAEGPHPGGVEVLSKVAESQAPFTGFTQFNLQAEDLSLEPGSYVYDVTLLPPTGYSSPIIKGYIEVGSNTDLESGNVYSGVEVGSEITVFMEHGDVVDITIERVDGLYIVVASLVEDFTEAMAIEVDKAAASAVEASESAELSKSYHDDMQVWLDNAGFPFWKGTYAEYQLITPKAEVLYLLVDEAVA
jgi:hypothetical protein